MENAVVHILVSLHDDVIQIYAVGLQDVNTLQEALSEPLYLHHLPAHPWPL